MSGTPHVAVPSVLAKSSVPLHRIGDVRQQQGLSLRTIARRTGLDSKELRRHEDPCSDLPLSILRKWQEALEVPVADLLEDDQSLSRPVKERAKMVRIMKTAVSLKDACQSNVRLARLAGMLCDQLLDLMPELKEVGSWPQTGSRRGADVMGRIFHEPISVETPDHE
ncbi:MAG: helix-turn-helix domain-containing protein [Pirellulales bacterium]